MVLSRLTGIIDQLIPEPHAGLLSGILFGTKETLPNDLYQSLVASGTLHIIALSGMNIAIITALVSNSLLRYVSRRISSLLTIVLIIGFILIVGPSPSVVRAGIMGSMSLVAVATGRQSWSLFALAATVLTMIVIHPPWITDISFQLSALATLGLILYGPSEKKKTNRSPVQTIQSDHGGIIPKLPAALLPSVDFIKEELHITLAAQVFTIPLVLYYFHRISLVSPLTNILIGWTIPIVMSLGFIMVFFGLVAPPLATPVAWVCWLMLDYIIRIIVWTGAIPFSSVQVGF